MAVLNDQQCKSFKCYCSAGAPENLVHTCNKCLKSMQHLWEAAVGMGASVKVRVYDTMHLNVPLAMLKYDLDNF